MRRARTEDMRGIAVSSSRLFAGDGIRFCERELFRPQALTLRLNP
ncbi:hypothetical protein ACFY4I_26245 [Streptomyces scabiei]